MTKILATCVLLAGFLFAGCATPEQRMQQALEPLIEQLPAIVAAVQEGGETEEGSRNVTVINIFVDLSWTLPLSMQVGR